MIGLSTMTKNQSLRLKEWILYHNKQGIDKFIIFLDNCTDNSKELLENIKIDYDIDIDIYLTEEHADKSIFQVHWIDRSHKIYDYVLKEYKHLQWIAFIEVDEFVFPQKNNLNLKSFLNSIETNCLYINSWDFKGPFNENKKILGQCYLSWKDEHRFNNGYRWRGKSIIKPTEFLKCVDAHHFLPKNRNVSKEFKLNRNYLQTNKGKEVYIDDNMFRIGHFRNHTPKTSKYNFISNKTMIKNVAIVGAGWYGCYIAEYLLDNFNHLNITIIEKNDDIFMESSYKNQNRLHLGYHYARDSITRNKCKTYFNKFLNKYEHLTEDIEKNYYAIANNSNIDYNTFLELYSDYDIVENTFLNNIEGNIINTNEKFINFIKVKDYFKKKLDNKVKILNNYFVKTIINNVENNTVKINEELEYDKVFNCTYNQIQSEDNVIYEKCLTLLYKKITDCPFNCLTIMDGNYSSLYNYKNDIYTLTNVKYTPLIKSNNFDDVKDYNDYNLNEKKKLFEETILNYYSEFKEKFEYYGFYESFKCKNISTTDIRDINININKNIFNTWCGKISLVNDLDKYLDKFIY